MDAILDDHYSKAEWVKKAKNNYVNQNKEGKPINDVNHFYFENFQSVPFDLLGYVRDGRSICVESSPKFAYQRFEIIQNIIGQSSGLRMYCFIPSRDLEGQNEIEKNQSKKVPYSLVGENAYSVSLFGVTKQMFGVHSTSRV